MKTVKEVSELTGISVRTLHYYDEIGLLHPTMCSEAGYRLYDDKALEYLQQILFFREFDIPLKEIKAVMESPRFDRHSILNSQKRILELKKERLEGLIETIGDILKGENTMSFEVFNKSEIEDMYEVMISHMQEVQKETIKEQYGTLEEFKEHFVKGAQTEAAQQNFKMMVKWYGSKEKVLDSMDHTASSDIFESYQKRSEEIYRKLAGKMGCDVNSFEVKSIIGELDFVMKQMFQMDDVSEMMKETAELYQSNEDVMRQYDESCGKGAAVFIGKAIANFYRS